MLNSNNHLLFKGIILALCIISCVHIFLTPLYEVNSERLLGKTFQDLERSLCSSNIKRKKITGRIHNCPQYGIVTVVQGGRLGNQMWEYAAVWALARRTGLEPYIPRCIKVKLDQAFSSLSVPTFEEIAHCPFEPEHFVKSLDEWNFTNQSIILPRFSLQPELVLNWHQDIRQEFTFRKSLIQKSQKVLRIASKNSTKKNVFVGLHIRRTDYFNYILKRFAAKPAHISFYMRAMKYFEEKYTSVIFIVTSDDPNWCIKHFSSKKNVYITGRSHPNTPALDLAILSSCNHSIFDYGTFGVWGAILAGGETIYYDLKQHVSAKIGEILPYWYSMH